GFSTANHDLEDALPAENLTRAEAAERAEHITTHAYEVDLDLTTGDEVFRSTTVLRFDAEAGRSTFVDLIAPRVLEVTLNGEALDPAAVFVDSRIQLDELALSNELRVVADCAYTNTGEGLHRFRSEEHTSE